MKKNRQTAFIRRQYMKEKDFELFYFSDQKLSPVAKHSHDNYELYFFLEGDVTITIDGQPWQMKPRDFYLVPPNTAHHPTMNSFVRPYRRFVLWIGQEYFLHLTEQSASYAFMEQQIRESGNYHFSCDTITFNTIQTMIFQIIDEQRNDRFGRLMQMHLALDTLLLYLNRIVYEEQMAGKHRAQQDLYTNICNYITDNLHTVLSLDKIASEFYLSKYYISHMFTAETGLSLHKYITKKRLLACRNAMVGDEPASSICLQYGFTDYTSFYRAFKKEYGISPREYREQMKRIIT